MPEPAQESSRRGPLAIPAPGIILNRREAMAKLKAFVHEPGSRMFTLLGVRGVGKTSLVAELALWCKASSETVIWYQCGSYLCSVEVLIDSLGGVLREQDGIRLRALLSETKRGERWLAAVGETIVEILQQDAYLFVFDDFENWLDDNSQIEDAMTGRLFLHLGEAVHKGKFIFVARQRVSLDPSGSLLPFGAEDQHELFGLPRADAIALLKRSGLDHVDEALLGDLAETCSRNPLALRVAAHLIGQKRVTPEQWLKGRVSPFPLEELAAEAVASLSPDIREAAELLSVFRREIAISTMPVLGLDFDRYVAPLHDRLILEFSQNRDGVVMASLFRNYFHHAMPPERQRVLHERAADYYGQVGVPESPRTFDDLASRLERVYHASRCGMLDQLGAEAVSCIESLVQLGYADVADREIGQLLPHLEGGEHHAPLVLLQGRVADRQADYEKALACFRDVLRLAHDDRDAQLLAQANYRIGRIHSAQSRFSQADEAFGRAIAIARTSGLHRELALVLVSRAWSERVRGQDTTVVLAHFQEALDAAREAQDARGLSETYRQMGFLYWEKRRDASEARRCYEKAMECAESTSDVKEITATHIDLGYLCAEWRDFGEAKKHCDLAVEGCLATGNRYALASAYWNLGNVFEKQQKYSEAIEWFDMSRKEFGKTHNDSGLALSLLRLAEVHHKSGHEGEVEPLLAQAEDLCKKNELKEIRDSIQQTREQMQKATQEDLAPGAEPKGREFGQVGIYVAPGGRLNVEGVTMDITNGAKYVQHITGGTFSQCAIASQQTLEHCFNTIQQVRNPELKTQLDELQAKVSDLLATLDTEQDTAKAADVRENYDVLVKEVTRDQPRRKWFDLSSEGLIEVAKTVKEMSGPIISVVSTIAKLLFP